MGKIENKLANQWCPQIHHINREQKNKWHIYNEILSMIYIINSINLVNQQKSLHLGNCDASQCFLVTIKCKIPLLYQSIIPSFCLWSFTEQQPAWPPHSDVIQWCHRVCRRGRATHAMHGGHGCRSHDRRADWGRGRVPAAVPGMRSPTGVGPGSGESGPCWSTPAGVKV